MILKKPLKGEKAGIIILIYMHLTWFDSNAHSWIGGERISLLLAGGFVSSTRLVVQGCLPCKSHQVISDRLLEAPVKETVERPASYESQVKLVIQDERGNILSQL